MAVGAPVMADTKTAAPAAAKNDMARNFVVRMARLFSLLLN
jgi:hypothetical protein